jgi:hypothetical protein
MADIYSTDSNEPLTVDPTALEVMAAIGEAIVDEQQFIRLKMWNGYAFVAVAHITLVLEGE